LATGTEEPAASEALGALDRPDAPAGSEASGGPIRWQQATVVDITDETPTAKTFRLALARPTPHLAGQHFVVRLTAPDGYQASRSYSVASAPGDAGEIELTVERLEDGEISSFLHDVVVPGDALEFRGPVGRWFVWEGETPALLLGGGSGIVPLMAMLRLARARGTSDRVRLVQSVRLPADLYYRDELPGPETTVVYTRVAPPGSTRPAGHLAADDLRPAILPDATAYVCGSAAFCDAATGLLTDLDFPVDRIRVERFGATG
jgi:ferredoxin-NADP reductase